MQTVTGRIVPLGTFGYLPLHLESGHGEGPHHNVFVARQIPAYVSKPGAFPCSCFWVKRTWVLGEGQLVPGIVPMEPFIYGPPV